MILTDREIEIAIQCGQLVISPKPEDQQYGPTTLDLTLAEEGLIWEKTAGVSIRPGAKNYKYSAIARLQKSVIVHNYTLEPQAFLLAWTAEKVHLPITSRIGARIEGKSSIARLGICVHITAPTIHPGFNDRIQLEMYNFGPHEIILDSGIKVCQLIFEQTLGTPRAGYTGQFSNQTKTP